MAWQLYLKLILVFCPLGWYSKKGICMKAFESLTVLNYSKAADNCQALGGQLAQPTNELESNTLTELLTNRTNLTSNTFWIG